MSARVLCFDRADQSRHQDAADRSDRRAALLDITQGRITAELTLLMVVGMNDPKNAQAVPFVQLPHPPQYRGKVCTQPMADAIMDALDYATVFEPLQTMLAESQCPLVAALKLSIARKIAEERAADLAMLECDE